MARRNIFGEMASKLRETLTTVASWIPGNPYLSGSYSLNTQKMKYQLTRQLYHNTADNYKLGAAFAKPIINTAVGFCGLPYILAGDPEAQDILDTFIKRSKSLLTAAQRNSFRDGDSYVRLMRLKNEDQILFKGEETAIQSFLVPPEYVDIIPDPVTGETEKVIIQTPVEYKDEKGNQYSYAAVETITRNQRTIAYTGRNVPADLKSEELENEWGFIPIIHFKNSAEPNELYGRSDLEVVEPLMKAYHDVMLQAMQSNKLNSNPKVKLKVESVDNFLKHNFTETQIAESKRTGKLDFNKDIYLLNVNEEMGFVEVTSAIGSAEVLLKFIFYCIVDASQTPEFAFGTAVQSSKASVSEQLVPLEKKIAMKRLELEIYYQQLARMILAMSAKAEAKAFSTYAVSFNWEDVSPRDEEQAANILNLTIQALTMALDSQIISQEAAVNFLATLVPTMYQFLNEDKDVLSEKERILTGQGFMQRVRDGLATTEAEKKALTK